MTGMPLVEALESDPQSQAQISKEAKGEYEREECRRENAVPNWIPYLRNAAPRYSKCPAVPLSKRHATWESPQERWLTIRVMANKTIGWCVRTSFASWLRQESSSVERERPSGDREDPGNTRLQQLSFG